MQDIILEVFILTVWAVYNIFVAATYSVKDMWEDFITAQPTVGKVFANLFYAPAWILKGIRFLICRLVR